MKSVTAFVGSARKNGVTHRATRQFRPDCGPQLEAEGVSLTGSLTRCAH